MPRTHAPPLPVDAVWLNVNRPLRTADLHGRLVLLAARAVIEGRPQLPADARGAAFCQEPEAVAFDGSRVLLADTGNHRVSALSPLDGSCEVLAGASAPSHEPAGN